jgi:hypothetical protein
MGQNSGSKFILRTILAILSFLKMTLKFCHFTVTTLLKNGQTAHGLNYFSIL